MSCCCVDGLLLRRLKRELFKYFITEYIEGPDALDLLGSMNRPNGELEALASLLSNLSESQISHGDMKATNFLMAEEGPVIIDLDAMREHKSKESFERAFDRDLDRFMENWEGSPELESRFESLLARLSSRKLISGKVSSSN